MTASTVPVISKSFLNTSGLFRLASVLFLYRKIFGRLKCRTVLFSFTFFVRNKNHLKVFESNATRSFWLASLAGMTCFAGWYDRAHLSTFRPTSSFLSSLDKSTDVIKESFTMLLPTNHSLGTNTSTRKTKEAKIFLSKTAILSWLTSWKILPLKGNWCNMNIQQRN